VDVFCGCFHIIFSAAKIDMYKDFIIL
jgi:hypothetical protein